MMTKKFACAALLVIFACGNASASEGFFISGGFGSAKLDESFDGLSGSDDSIALRLGVGWKFSEHFALEAGYQDFGDFEYRLDISNQPANSGQSRNKAKLSADGFTFGAIGYLPLKERLSLYGRAGMYFWDGNAEINFVSQASPEDTNPYFGVGLSYAISEKVHLIGDWTHFDLEGANGEVLTIGLQILFGR